MGPPPPGATRELGVVAMLLSLMDIRPEGRTVNTHESSLFTGMRGRGVLRSWTCVLRSSRKVINNSSPIHRRLLA